MRMRCSNIDNYVKAADEMSAALRARVATLGPVEIARRAGIKYNDVSMWYNGHRKWSTDKIARVLQKVQ